MTKKPHNPMCCHRVLISGRGAMGDGYDCACCDFKSYSIPLRWYILRILGLARMT